MSNDNRHLSLVKTDVDEPRTHPALPKGVPLIVLPAGPGDEDDDEDFDDEDVGTIVRRRPPLGPSGHQVLSDGSEPLDMRRGTELLHKALAELTSVRRRYARLEVLAPVFAAVEQVVLNEAEPDRARLAVAVFHAKQMVEREGFDLRTAAERASEVHGAKVADVLEGLRERAAG